MYESQLTPQTLENAQDVHTILTLKNIFLASLNNFPTKGKPVLLKCIYRKTDSKPYSYGEGGVRYYDQAIDEESNSSIKVVVPELLRSRLNDGELHVFKGFLNSRIVGAGDIEINFYICESIFKEENRVSPTEMKAIELLRIKANKGYADIERIIKNHYAEYDVFLVCVIAGKSSVACKDFDVALADAKKGYVIHEHAINITNKLEIIEAIKSQGKNHHALLITRGGGNVDIFDDPDIAEAIINSPIPVITAIGHASDKTLSDKVADKSLSTPTKAGEYFKDVHYETTEDNLHSKAKLIESIQTEMESKYGDRIQVLKKDLQEVKERNQSNIITNESIIREIAQIKQKNKTLTIALVIACALLMMAYKAIF